MTWYKNRQQLFPHILKLGIRRIIGIALIPVMIVTGVFFVTLFREVGTKLKPSRVSSMGALEETSMGNIVGIL